MKRKTNSSPYRNQQKTLLEVNALSLSFLQYEKGLRESSVEVIKNFDLQINAGEIVAVVGASGTGKSLLADAIMGILPKGAQQGGNIFFKGDKLNQKRQNQLRGSTLMLIPQSLKALNPLVKSGKQVRQAVAGKDAKKLQEKAFEKLGLPLSAGDKYPFELSGGMARRVLIAVAMVSKAQLIIADEPTPGLDEHSRDEILIHLKALANEGRGILFITHDIHAALQIADKVAVCNAGETLEIADKQDFSGKGEKLKHPYTKALWNALPENGFKIPTDKNIDTAQLHSIKTKTTQKREKTPQKELQNTKENP